MATRGFHAFGFAILAEGERGFHAGGTSLLFAEPDVGAPTTHAKRLVDNVPLTTKVHGGLVN